jgi:glycerol-3-phosphate dehydrogenase (NAD(P)+)
MKRVVIIGAGEIGSAIGRLLRGARVEFFDAQPGKVRGQRPLAKSVPSAEVVFFCIHSRFARQALFSAAPYLKRRTVVVSVSKGIEFQTRFTMDQLFTHLLGARQPFAMLCGPMLAEELDLKLPGGAVIGTKSDAAYRTLVQLLRGTSLKLERSKDVHGVALAGVLKNIYAIGLGVSSALKLGSNFSGWYIQASAAEMAGIIGALGGKPQTAYGPAGLGDFITTGLSPYSQNQQMGQDLVRRGTCAMTSEGCVSLPSLVKLLGARAKSFPILTAIRRTLEHHTDAKKIFIALAHGRA